MDGFSASPDSRPTQTPVLLSPLLNLHRRLSAARRLQPLGWRLPAVLPSSTAGGSGIAGFTAAYWVRRPPLPLGPHLLSSFGSHDVLVQLSPAPRFISGGLASQSSLFFRPGQHVLGTSAL
ncbi:hypothetical protein GUJ93_ZPchr0010g7776 [Zizania palustris]|uniref:Uncharacterized protein n=1 Tax=Zizania palustris TaxID=103762 RepID=A0A8J6BHF9_ZIZPA|nr:hypothetical protein GUJ93_ZPchr0010g7776 [Zizania palustris]